MTLSAPGPDGVAVEIRRRYVPTPVGTVHLAEAGPLDGQVLLCLHQTPRSWNEFHELLGLLSGVRRVVAPDLPGMGASDPLERPATIEDYAVAAVGVLDHLEVDRADVFGHHTGGLVAVEMAAGHPDRVARLVLSSTPFVDEEGRRMRAGRAPIDEYTVSPDGAHLRGLWAGRARWYPPDRPDLLARYVVDALRAAHPEEGHLACARYRSEDRMPLIAHLPVLLLWHRADPFADAEFPAMLAALPSAHVTELPNGSIPLELSAAQVAPPIERFLGLTPPE